MKRSNPMKSFLLALLCAAPLVVGYNTGEVSQPVSPVEASAPVELVYLTSMGCDLAGCTDPDHCHYCPADCADPAHFHACPVGCTDPSHPCCGQCWEYTEEAAPSFCPSMGCDLVNCTDPSHYHYCPFGCTEAAHCHDCPVGCQNAAHPHGGWHHSAGRGHHHGWNH